MTEPWESLAWQLWRFRHHTFVEIARFFCQQGWDVEPAEVEAVVMLRAADELARAFA